MKSVMMTYPGFRELPKGVKKMLLVSETFFFGEARIPTARSVRSAVPVTVFDRCAMAGSVAQAIRASSADKSSRQADRITFSSG